MTRVQSLKNELEQHIQYLSEERLNHLVNYAKLLSQQEKIADRYTHVTQKKYIEEYIGGISHGSLAKDIDNELYGE